MKCKDYYSLLEIKRTASGDEIKKAYRALAKKYHPDANIGNTEAEEIFKDINEAYEVLGNPEKKRKYDSILNRFNFLSGFEFDPSKFGYKHETEFSGSTDGAFSDFYDLFFGQDSVEFDDKTFETAFYKKEEQLLFKRGEDVFVNYEVTLEEAFYGLETTIQIKTAANKIKEYEITIPEGSKTGDKIKLMGKGLPGVIGAPPGDLYVNIVVKKHDLFTIKGKDLETDILITPWEAIFGGIDGKLNVKIPAGVQTSDKLRIAGKGYKNGVSRGDLLGRIKIVVPSNLTDKEKELFKELQKISNFEPRKVM